MKISPRRLAPGLLFVLSCAGVLFAQTAAGPAPTPAAPAALTVPPRVDPWVKAPDAEKKVFATVDDLVAKGKWKSAWDVLSAADATHTDPWFLARSIAVALDGHVDTKQHLAFTFVDLAEGTTLEIARGSAVGAGDIAFDPLALADAQAAANIAPVPALEFELSRYLSEVESLYKGSWRMPDEEIVARESEARESARTDGVYDAASLQAEAEADLDKGDGQDAEVLAVAAEGLGTPAAKLRYDHAIALLMQHRFDEGLAIIDATLAIDKDPASRSGGLTLGAQAAAMAGKEDKVETYLDTAEKEQPDSPRPYLFRHYLYASKGETDKANEAADMAIKRFGPDPQIVSTIVKSWFDAGDPSASLPFLDKGLADNASNDAAMTVFGLYKAMVIVRTATGPDSVKDVGALLDATEEHAKKGFPNNQGVLNALDSLRNTIAQMAAEQPTPDQTSPTEPAPSTVPPAGTQQQGAATTPAAPATAPAAPATAPATTAPATPAAPEAPAPAATPSTGG